jgi:hypothetical protein
MAIGRPTGEPKLLREHCGKLLLPFSMLCLSIFPLAACFLTIVYSFIKPYLAEIHKICLLYESGMTVVYVYFWQQKWRNEFVLDFPSLFL